MEERDFELFKDEVLGRRGKGKVTNSWGVYDALKYIRKNKWFNIGRPLKESEFYKIVREVNKLLADEIAAGNEVVFPANMGRLELRKTNRGVSMKNGKLKITYPIDWDSTLRLWFKDEEARKNKILLRRENKEVYNVKYVKFDATYENKTFYEFVLNKFIKLRLKDNIINNRLDTLWQSKVRIQ